MAAATASLLAGRVCTLASRRLTTSSACAASSGRMRELKLRHILVSPDKAPVLDECEKRLQGGQPFEAVAQEFSECGVSARKGGDLGWMASGQFFPSFMAVAAVTPVGQRGRTSSPRGAHLLLVEAERMVSRVSQMTVQELSELLQNPAAVEETQFIDVREPWEEQEARLQHFRLLPLSQASEWMPTIKETHDVNTRTVCLCHHGVRSMQMSQFLIQQGFTDVSNIVGGISAYSRGVDPSVPEY